MKIFKLFILLILQLEYALSSETLLIGNDDSYKVLSYSEYSAVKKMDETPDSLTNNTWHKNKLDMNYDKKHQGYWVRIKVKNSKNISKELYLIDERRYVYTLEYYLLKNGKITTHKKDGFYVKENASSFNASQRIFPLFLEAEEEAEILFKVQNFNMLDMPFKIVNKKYLLEYFPLYSFLQGAFFMVLLVFAIYNSITYFFVKFKAYFYYLAYVLFLIIYQGGYFGYLKLLGVPATLVFALMAIGGVGFVIFAIFFMKELFQVKKHLPKINKIFSLMTYYLLVVLFIYVISIILVNFYVSQLMFNLISIAVSMYVFILFYALAYFTYKKINKIAFFYMLVWGIVLVFGLLLLGMHFSIVSTDLGIDYLFEFGIFLESILFSVILAYKIKEIEEEKQTQQLMLVQQNRLASMGEMISTIAHQWRQPLSQINGRVLGLDIDYKKKRLTDDIMEAHLLDIENTTAHMSEVINDFMNFFNSKKKIEKFWISEIITESIRITNMSSSKKIKIESNIEEIKLKSYKSELIQALLIVINNGIDAYSGDEMAKITIEVKKSSENLVEINIKDNGDGISDEVLLHLFEPYYTTKHKSQGTGLGLYILKMIIENGMGGRASIQNHTSGTVFMIVIPRVL